MPNIIIISSVATMLLIIAFALGIIILFLKESYLVILIKESQELLHVISFILFVLSYLLIIAISSCNLNELNGVDMMLNIASLKLWAWSVFGYIFTLSLLVVYKIEKDIFNNELMEEEEESKHLCKDCDGEYVCENMHSEICHLNQHFYVK